MGSKGAKCGRAGFSGLAPLVSSGSLRVCGACGCCGRLLRRPLMLSGGKMLSTCIRATYDRVGRGLLNLLFFWSRPKCKSNPE